MRIGWLSSGRDEAARELLLTAWRKMAEGFIPAEIAFVFSSREEGEDPEGDRFLALSRELGLLTLSLSAERFEPELRGRDREAWRCRYHQEVARLIAPYGADLIMLAGYMLIVSPEMCWTFPMVNLHPALPGGPTGAWQEVIWRLIQEGAEETGAMIHLVTEELDRGPVVTFCSFPLRGEDFDPLWEEVRGRSLEELRHSEGERLPLFQRIRAEGLKREHPLIVLTLKALAEGRLRLQGRRVLEGEGRPLLRGLCLTEEVEEYLKRER